MKKMSNKKMILMSLAMALILIISAMGTLAYMAKESNTVVNTFTAAGGGEVVDPTNPTPGPDLEEGVVIEAGFYLLESKAQYASANYTLGTKQVLSNTYDKVVPAMAIPKDPKLTLNIAEGADVYVFVKVTDTTGGNLTYTVDSANWTQVSVAGLTANEKVYCYKNSIQTGAAGVELNNVSILQGNQVTAAATLSDTDNTQEGLQLGEIKAEGYVCQAGGFDSAAAAFKACFMS